MGKDGSRGDPAGLMVEIPLHKHAVVDLAPKLALTTND